MKLPAFHISLLFPSRTARRILITFMVMMTLGGLKTAVGQVNAAFTSDVSTGCAPLLVRFTDNSTGSPTSWLWNFGNGITSTDPSPLAQIPFNTPGDYTVTLTVSNGASTNTTTKIIRVLEPPKATITFTDSVGCFPFTVPFNATVDPGSSTVTGYSWDFGDGTPFSTGNAPTHTYRIDGLFGVTLTVDLSNGCSKKFPADSRIRVSPGVKADFYYPVVPTCRPPVTVTFNNQSSGPGTLTYLWNFGNGSTSTQQNDATNYNTGGRYDVKLITTSNSGCSDTMVKTINIPTTFVQSAFTAPDTVCLGQFVNFRNTSNPDPDSSFWFFGDGTTSSLLTPINKFYSTAGSYDVKLVNKFGACLDSATRTVVVSPSPIANYSTTGTSSCRAPLTVNFTNVNPAITNSLWAFNNGVSPTLTATGNTVTVTFRDTGSYDMWLQVVDARGCSSITTPSKVVNISPLRVDLKNVPDSGCAPFTLRPTVTATSIDGIQSYLWTWGDGTTDTSPTATHTYASTGNYNPTLRIRTATGCDTLITPGTVKVGSPPPPPNFSSNLTSSCAGGDIQFTDLTSGAGVTGWKWTFGDGFADTVKNPIHKYADIGTFNVTLTVYNNGCGASITKPALMNITGTVARFSTTVDCANKLQASFAENSINAVTWQWDFGDGSVFTGQNPPPHVYPAKNDYTVSLTTSDGTCSFTQTGIVHIQPQPPDFVVIPFTICKGIDANFSAINSEDVYIKKYEWDFGNGIFNQGLRAVTSLFPNSGTYNIRLRITDINGCLDSSMRVLAIGGPKAGFGSVNPSGCKGLTVNFQDTSRTDGVSAILTRYWDFGDGSGRQMINSGPVSHFYPNAGSYSVKLVVIDAGGCTDSITLIGFVNTTEPKAKFTVSDTVACPGTQIQFKSIDAGTINNFQWKFGDGTTSPAPETFHPYSTVGTYSVQLKIRDRYGCEDSSRIDNLIRIDTPHAAFTVTDTIGSCPPLEVGFTFKGSFYKSFKWVFGDSANSAELNPKHSYTRSGNYLAMLIVTSPGGCDDTAFQLIQVKGPNGFLSFTPPAACPGTPINFTLSNPTDIDSLLWNFGDSTALNTLFNMTHIYDKPATDASGAFRNYPANVTLIDKFKCRVTIYGPDSSVRIVGVVANFGSDKKQLCANGDISFIDSTRSNGILSGRLWDFGDGTTSTDVNPVHHYTTPGSYTVKMTAFTQEGCSDTKTIANMIKVVAPPNIAITQSIDSLCRNGQVTFAGIEVVPDTSALSWKWDFGNGGTSDLQNPAPQTYKVAGDITAMLVATNSSSCHDTAFSIVHVQPLPSTDASIDSTICLGQSIQLSVTGANRYQWQPSPTLTCLDCPDPTANPTTSTLYFVTGFTAFGCSTTDSTWLYVIQPSTVVAPPDDSVCYSQALRLTATGTQVYTWTPTAGLSDPRSPSPTARPQSTTTYVVTGSDYKSCFVSTDSVLITVFPYPLLDIGRDTTISVGASLPIVANVSQDVRSILWQPTSTLSCQDCLDPVARPSTSTTYQAIVTNDGGCTTTDEIRVTVVCNNANIFMPNTFSPNGDGMNDIYYPRGHGVQTIKSLRIFSRWGQLLFEKQNFNANDASAGWDGRFRSTALTPDVYVYIMEYVCENGVIVATKGDITLVR